MAMETIIIATIAKIAYMKTITITYFFKFAACNYDFVYFSGVIPNISYFM